MIALYLAPPSAKGRAAAREDRVPPAPAQTGTEPTVILSDSSDTYYGLALEIAGNEEIPVVHSLEDLFAADPRFVLWILSPGAFSDSLLVRFGLAVEERELPFSWGIITGSTVGSARRLYERSCSPVGNLSSVHAREGVTIVRNDGEDERVPLDRSSLSRVMAGSRYLVFSGHGGGRYWRIDKDRLLAEDDIPPLPPLAVTTGACSTFRPWVDGSIALAFTDAGAAAYAGFLYSPAPFYLMGHPDGFPLQHAWTGFTVGDIVAIQNRGSMKGFAAYPFYHLLGDPRLAFRSKAPYRLVEDRREGDKRTLVYADAPSGFLPVRIVGGGSYDYIEIAGVSSSGARDHFYNGALEMMRRGGDLYVLFDHEGGGFTVLLERTPPRARVLIDGLADAFDHTYIFLPSTNSTIFLLIVSASVLLGTIWFVLRKGLVIRGAREALAIGISFALLKAAYALVRMDRISVVSYDVEFNPYYIVGVSILAGCGALFFLNVRSRLWKAASLLIAGFPNWAIAGFWCAGITYINLFEAVPRIGTRLYRYPIGLLPAIVFGLETLVLLLLLMFLERRICGRPYRDIHVE